MTTILGIPESSAMFVKILSAVGVIGAAIMARLAFIHSTSKAGKDWVSGIMQDCTGKIPRWLRMLAAAAVLAGIVAVGLSSLFQTEKNAVGVALRRDLNGLAASIWGQFGGETGEPDELRLRREFGERIEALVKRVQNDGLYSKEFREAYLLTSRELRLQPWTNLVNAMSNTAKRVKIEDEK